MLCTKGLAESAGACVRNTRRKFDEQWDCRSLEVCAMKIEGWNRGVARGDTPVTMAVQKLENILECDEKKKIAL